MYETDKAKATLDYMMQNFLYFDRTLATELDLLIQELAEDEVIKEADTLNSNGTLPDRH